MICFSISRTGVNIAREAFRILLEQARLPKHSASSDQLGQRAPGFGPSAFRVISQSISKAIKNVEAFPRDAPPTPKS